MNHRHFKDLHSHVTRLKILKIKEMSIICDNSIAADYMRR